MRLWSGQVVPRLIDVALDLPQLHELRARTCAGLSGEVVEIGYGSGLNAVHYPPSVERVLAVEPSEVAWHLAEGRRTEDGRAPVVRAGLDGQAIDLPDDSVDDALSTFSLCTIPHPVEAVRQLARVMRDGGTFHFLEHGLAPDPAVVRWQHLLTPVQRRLFAGCHLDRPIAEIVASGGLVLTEVETSYFWWPKAIGSLYVGRAVKP